MDDATILEKVKLALRIVTNDFNDEIADLIKACKSDLQAGGVIVSVVDEFILQAIKTYCKANFGNPSNYDRLKASYDEQKAQLGMRSGYTKWVN